MTPFQIAKTRMLPLIGITSFDPATNATTAGKRAVEEGDIQFCVDCMNAAAEEMLDEGPACLSETDYSDVLLPPTAVTLTTIQYSKVLSGFLTWAAWMEGCTVRLSGDDVDNVLLSATALLRPYMGSGGAQSGTVYGDSLKMPSTVKSIMEPVRLPTVAPLRVTLMEDEFYCYAQPHLYGNRPGVAVYNSLTNKSVGEPVIALAQFVAAMTVAGVTPKFLRFNPMPAQAYSATMRVKLKPPLWTTADVYAGTAYTVDPAAVIPFDNHSSIFLPMALWRFLAHPSFDNKNARESINAQYALAKKQLDQLTPATVSIQAHYHG